MRHRWVMGNWKMNGSSVSIESLLTEIQAGLPKSLSCSVAVFPPALYIPMVREKLSGSNIAWGAQNVYPAIKGAYTGEISAPMLHEMDCRFVLVGHSERRHVFGESSAFVAQKFCHVKAQGMTPVLCIGETQADRQQGLTEKVLAEQLDAVLTFCDTGLQACIIAYEPVWAIGTGVAATTEQVQAVHAWIRGYAHDTPILYGGSVNAENAAALMALADVDGVLVGGASIEARQFLDIITCIN